MPNLNFRLWFESSQRRPVQDASGIAQRWMSAIPPENDHPQNDTEVWVFVEAMADPKKNAIAINKFMSRMSFPPETRYGPKKIAGNLLLSNSKFLKEAKGEIVFDVAEALFGFGVDGPVKGSLLIAHPPLAFNHIDRALLAGIIEHELRHASDFVSMGGVSMAGTGELAATDADAYLSHIVESRAYADQLRWLLRMMGNNTKMVIDALHQSNFGMDEDMRKCAEYFLEEFVKSPKMRGEAFDTDYSTLKPSPQHVGTLSGMSDKRQVTKAASLVLAIMDKFRFSNNVKVPFNVRKT